MVDWRITLLSQLESIVVDKRLTRFRCLLVVENEVNNKLERGAAGDCMEVIMLRIGWRSHMQRAPAATYLINHIRQIKQRDSELRRLRRQHARALPAPGPSLGWWPPVTRRPISSRRGAVVLLANDVLMSSTTHETSSRSS